MQLIWIEFLDFVSCESFRASLCRTISFEMDWSHMVLLLNFIGMYCTWKNARNVIAIRWVIAWVTKTTLLYWAKISLLQWMMCNTAVTSKSVRCLVQFFLNSTCTCMLFCWTKYQISYMSWKFVSFFLLSQKLQFRHQWIYSAYVCMHRCHK